jgi:hypothetical protein
MNPSCEHKWTSATLFTCEGCGLVVNAAGAAMLGADNPGHEHVWSTAFDTKRTCIICGSSDKPEAGQPEAARVSHKALLRWADALANYGGAAEAYNRALAESLCEQAKKWPTTTQWAARARAWQDAHRERVELWKAWAELQHAALDIGGPIDNGNNPSQASPFGSG